MDSMRTLTWRNSGTIEAVAPSLPRYGQFGRVRETELEQRFAWH